MKKEEESARGPREARSRRARALGGGAPSAVRKAFPLHVQFCPVKECPLCGEVMRLKAREVRDSVPGGGQGTVRVLREWICPECDHFEEAEAGEGNS